jgi:peptidoglycan/xylan/chitin deacetylase (PgdA/CDA1 family)
MIGVPMIDSLAFKMGARRAVYRTVDTLVGTQWGPVGNVRTCQPLVALTFDDGPDPRWTPQILDILAEHNARASFFILVQNARRFPELVQRVVGEGHEVCLHGIDHQRLTGGSRRSTRLLLDAAASELAAISGAPVEFFRPPYGAQTVSTFLGERDAGLETVMWDVDSFDWRGLGEQEVSCGVIDRARPGSIVLLHDTLADDPECSFDRARSVRLIMDGLQRRSLRSATLSTLMASGICQRAAHFPLSIQSGKALRAGPGRHRRP